MDAYTIEKLRKIAKELRKASNMHAEQADRIDACIKRAESGGSYSSRKRKANSDQ